MPKRGEVYWATLDPVTGREQSGRRPVLIVTSDAINKQPLVVTVVVGTDSAHLPRDYPTNVRILAAESSLPKDTVFLCFQMRSIDQSRLEGRNSTGAPLAVLSPVQMHEVELALRKTLSL